jgi:hypothetical protein
MHASQGKHVQSPGGLEFQQLELPAQCSTAGGQAGDMVRGLGRRERVSPLSRRREFPAIQGMQLSSPDVL